MKPVAPASPRAAGSQTARSDLIPDNDVESRGNIGGGGDVESAAGSCPELAGPVSLLASEAEVAFAASGEVEEERVDVRTARKGDDNEASEEGDGVRGHQGAASSKQPMLAERPERVRKSGPLAGCTEAGDSVHAAVAAAAALSEPDEVVAVIKKEAVEERRVSNLVEERERNLGRPPATSSTGNSTGSSGAIESGLPLDYMRAGGPLEDHDSGGGCPSGVVGGLPPLSATFSSMVARRNSSGIADDASAGRSSSSTQLQPGGDTAVARHAAGIDPRNVEEGTSRPPENREAHSNTRSSSFERAPSWEDRDGSLFSVVPSERVGARKALESSRDGDDEQEGEDDGRAGKSTSELHRPASVIRNGGEGSLETSGEASAASRADGREPSACSGTATEAPLPIFGAVGRPSRANANVTPPDRDYDVDETTAVAGQTAASAAAADVPGAQADVLNTGGAATLPSPVPLSLNETESAMAALIAKLRPDLPPPASGSSPPEDGAVFAGEAHGAANAEAIGTAVAQAAGPESTRRTGGSCAAGLEKSIDVDGGIWTTEPAAPVMGPRAEEEGEEVPSDEKQSQDHGPEEVGLSGAVEGPCRGARGERGRPESVLGGGGADDSSEAAGGYEDDFDDD